MSLYLTYVINYLNDGFGSQYHHIVGIFCVAKLIGAKYLHTPVETFEHLPTEYSSKINEHFGLSIFEAGKNGRPNSFENTINDTLPNTLEQLQVDTGGQNTLIKIGIACVMDNTDVVDKYDIGMDELRKLKKKIDLPEFKHDKKNIAIHIRRGDVSSNSTKFSNRFTDNNFYIKVIEKLNKKYANCNILIFSQGTEGFDEFKNIENVKLMNDLDILETFEYLCNADVLIMSKSSLSYLAGLYNPNEVYMEKFEHWNHIKLSRWNDFEELLDNDNTVNDNTINDNTIESYSNISNMNTTNNIYILFIFVLLFLFIFYCNKSIIIRFLSKKNRKFILIVMLIFIIIGFLFYSTETFNNNSQKIWAMSFGGGEQNYHDAAYRVSNEVKISNIFNEIVIFTDKDLKSDTEFWEKNGNFIESNKRGYGYWLWKPYLIMKTLERMNDNDILVYLDSGCEVANNENTYDSIMKHINKCDEYNILYTYTEHDEKTYTKMDLFDYMNVKNNENILNSTQNQATLIIIKKTPKTIELVKEWYTIGCNHHFIDDSASILPNAPSFREHRHDQSIFSLLTKKYDMNDTNNSFDAYPFLLSRKRNG